MKPLRLAVVGVGHLGKHHARLISGMPGVTLVGVVDPDAESRTRVAADYGATPFASVHEVVGLIDGAVIATPTRFHHAVAARLLECRIPLLVEKPLAANLAEADDLVALARRNGVALQVGHVERFNPAFRAVLPHLGQPKYLEAVRAGSFTFRSTDIGVVLDLMIHDIDLVLALARSPLSRIEALGASVFGRHEDVANARLTFANGCVASLSASRASYQSQRRLHAWSERAFAAVDFSGPSATIVRPSESIAARSFDVDSFGAEEKSRLKERLFDEVLPLERLDVAPANALLCELEDFVAAIREAREPVVNGEAGRDALSVAEEVLAQIDAHAWSGDLAGPRGPQFSTATPGIIPAPHFRHVPQTARREAG